MDPLVSVCVVAYNQKDFIRQCLDSILEQRTNFEFEILIGEDGSIDGTRQICEEYASKYPGKIRLFQRSRKDVIYVNGRPTARFNFISNVKASKGKYIALLDGDDYWTDPLKLQKQFDVLEKNLDCVACHHWHMISSKDKNGNFEEKEAPKRAEDGYLNAQKADVGSIFSFQLRPQSRTLMFRNIFRTEDFPAWFKKIQFGDVGLAFILGKHGTFFFMDEVMAAYRVHGNGASSIFKDNKGFILGNKEWLKLFVYAFNFYDHSFEKETAKGISIFLSRIREKTNNSLVQRLSLIRFILFKIKTRSSLKKTLITSLLKNT